MSKKLSAFPKEIEDKVLLCLNIREFLQLKIENDYVFSKLLEQKIKILELAYEIKDISTLCIGVKFEEFDEEYDYPFGINFKEKKEYSKNFITIREEKSYVLYLFLLVCCYILEYEKISEISKDTLTYKTIMNSNKILNEIFAYYIDSVIPIRCFMNSYILERTDVLFDKKVEDSKIISLIKTENSSTRSKENLFRKLEKYNFVKEEELEDYSYLDHDVSNFSMIDYYKEFYIYIMDEIFYSVSSVLEIKLSKELVKEISNLFLEGQMEEILRDIIV